jgi:hypothetical protein
MSEPVVGDRVLTRSGKLGRVVELGTMLGKPIAHVLCSGWLVTRWYYFNELEVITAPVKSRVT